MTPIPPELVVTDLCKHYGSIPALHPICLTMRKGEFVTILGPSGCGKSTLLRIIMGVTAASAGKIHLSGRRIDTEPPERRNTAMVFQTHALFPHMSVGRNLSFGLRMHKVPKNERERRIAHAVDICDLGAQLDRMPCQLSGGQRQRVALARAIVLQPALLLLDEPLSSLDARLRESLCGNLVSLHRRVGCTSLCVTHDQAEAMAMSDRVIVMNKGRVVEDGPPADLYRTPVHAFTAAFLGQTNLLTLEAASERAGLPWGGEAMLDRSAHGPVTVSLRPENIAMRVDKDGPGMVTAISFQGVRTLYELQIAGATLRVSRNGSEDILPIGSRVAVTPAQTLRVLETGEPD